MTKIHSTEIQRLLYFATSFAEPPPPPLQLFLEASEYLAHPVACVYSEKSLKQNIGPASLCLLLISVDRGGQNQLTSHQCNTLRTIKFGYCFWKECYNFRAWQERDLVSTSLFLTRKILQALSRVTERMRAGTLLLALIFLFFKLELWRKNTRRGQKAKTIRENRGFKAGISPDPLTVSAV